MKDPFSHAFGKELTSALETRSQSIDGEEGSVIRAVFEESNRYSRGFRNQIH
jgi:hypothetical protein